MLFRSNNVLDSDQIKLTDVPVLHAKLHENSIDSLQNETVVVESNISQGEAPPTNPTPTPPPPTAPTPTRPPSTPVTPGGGGTQRGGGIHRFAPGISVLNILPSSQKRVRFTLPYPKS